jgi:hypothetical protein
MQLSIPYAITGPDGTRIVLGNSAAARADPDYIGGLDSEQGVTINREVRDSSDPASDTDGAFHGTFRRGRATLVFNGSIDTNVFYTPTLFNAAEAKILRATRALSADAVVRYTPDGLGEHAWWCRLAQDPGSSFTGRRPKGFQIQLISRRPYAMAPTETVKHLLYAQAMKNEVYPALYWRLGESVGPTAVDSSLNGRHGTFVGSITLSQPGAIVGDPDTSISFDGSTGRITTTFNPFVVGSTCAVGGWAKRRSSGSGDTLFGSDGANPALLALNASSNDVRWFANVNSGAYAAWGNAWPGNNQWVHWVLIYNDATRVVELFINGVSKGAQTLGVGQTLQATAGNLKVASWGSALNDLFDGWLDEFEVWTGPWPSAANVANMYQAGLAQYTSGGTAPTWPRFVISGPITNPTITNNLTGETVRFNMALNSGEFVEIRSDPLGPAAVLFGASKINRYSYFDRANSRWWSLYPGPQAVVWTASGIDSTTSDIAMYSRDAWD